MDLNGPLATASMLMRRLETTETSLTLSCVGISHREEGPGIGNSQVESSTLADTTVVHVASDVHGGDGVDRLVGVLSEADVANVEVDRHLDAEIMKVRTWLIK